MEKEKILKAAKDALDIEAREILRLKDRIDENFLEACNAILSSKGRVIITGMGKSGITGRKIAASFSSVGIPSFFIHSAEASHGDLGVITKKDIVMVISKSGETDEVLKILPKIKSIGAKVIALCGNKNSTLAKNSDILLDVNIEREADPLDLVPTASTIVSQAMGDAFLSALIFACKFKREDFGYFHPGGAAGRMFLKVKELMHKGDENPVIKENKVFREALFVITSKKLGSVSIVNSEGEIVGIITDGDVRRLIQRFQDAPEELFKTEVKNLMTKNPKTVSCDAYATEAVKKMEDNAITVLPVINKRKRPIGMLHLHDLVKAGFALEQKEEIERR